MWTALQGDEWEVSSNLRCIVYVKYYQYCLPARGLSRTVYIIVTTSIAQGIETADCTKLVFNQGRTKQVRAQTEKKTTNLRKSNCEPIKALSHLPSSIPSHVIYHVIPHYRLLRFEFSLILCFPTPQQFRFSPDFLFMYSPRSCNLYVSIKCPFWKLTYVHQSDICNLHIFIKNLILWNTV